jgi:hypothetical protein
MGTASKLILGVIEIDCLGDDNLASFLDKPGGADGADDGADDSAVDDDVDDDADGVCVCICVGATIGNAFDDVDACVGGGAGAVSTPIINLFFHEVLDLKLLIN